MKKRSVWFVCFLLVLVILAAFSWAQAESAPSLSLSETSVTLSKGNSTRLTPVVQNLENGQRAIFSWISSDESVVRVANGILRAVDGGRAVVTCVAQLPDGAMLQASADVVVTVPVASLRLLSPNPLSIQAGQTVLAQYSLFPANATDPSLDWSSSNESVATVDSTGSITARGAGSARITAATRDGSGKNMQFNVYVPSLSCSADTVRIDATDGASVVIDYYGTSWDTDVTVTTRGDAFTCSAAGSGSSYTLQFWGVSPGSGSVTVSDKKDPKSRIVLNVSVVSSAVPENRYILFTNAVCNKTSFRFSYTNNCGMDIEEYTLAVIAYNREDEPIFTAALVGEEPCFYNIREPLKAGASCTFDAQKDYGGQKRYADADHVSVALASVRLANGTEIILPDAALLWFSSKTRSYQAVLFGVPGNTRPEESVLAQAKDFRLGFTSTPLHSWMNGYFGFRRGGEYVFEASPDSVAGKAGLRAGDLIVAADGLNVCDDNYAVEKAKAKLAAGQSVVFTVERLGQEGTVDLAFSPAGSGEAAAFANPVYSAEFIALQERKLALVPELFPQTYVIDNASYSGSKASGNAVEEETTEHFDGFTFRSRNLDATRRELSIIADTVSTGELFNRGWDLYDATTAHSNFYQAVEVQCTKQDESAMGWFWFQYGDLQLVGDEKRHGVEIVFPLKIDAYTTTPESGRTYTRYYDLSSDYAYDNETHILEIIRYHGYTSCYIDHHFVTGFEDGFNGYYYPMYGVGINAGGKEAVFVTDHIVKSVQGKGTGAPSEGCFLNMHAR